MAPDREDELIDAIRARAEEIADVDEDMATDGPSKGALAIGAVVLAAFEKLAPLFPQQAGPRARDLPAVAR